jgi:lysozyme
VRWVGFVVPATLIVVLSVVAIARWWVLPRYRPALQAGEAYGIDVSSHQGNIDWTRVRSNGIAFAYIKATEGDTYTDPDFADDTTRAASNGVAVGAYHFFSLCDPGTRQADHFLAVTAHRNLTLPPALDLEFGGSCHTRPDQAEVRAQVNGFVHEVQRRTGRPVLVYESAAFAQGYREVGPTVRWVPRFLFRPGGAWTVWQVDGIARVPGVDGSVDLDVGRRSLLSTSHGRF